MWIHPSSAGLARSSVRYARRVEPRALALAIALLAGGLAATAQAQTNEQQHGKPLTVKPDIPGVQTNQRLILKDGSYQIVRKYEIVGDRVRYISVERGGEWEELPRNLVDWDATKRWAQKQQADDDSPAMKEAADVDKEEADTRREERERSPEVAKGLTLPDADGVFVLDEFQGTPQLVELAANTGDLQMTKSHGLRQVVPLGGQRALFELAGTAAKIALHVNQPTFYLSLDTDDDAPQVLDRALTVNTHGAAEARSRKQGAASPDAGFALVRLDIRRAVRVVGQVHVSTTGEATHTEDVVPVKAEVMAGRHWLKVTPQEPLLIGEYALIEILSPSELNASVWDFEVNPRASVNESAMVPIQSQ